MGQESSVNEGVEIERTGRVGYAAMKKAGRTKSKPAVNLIDNAFSTWAREERLDIDWSDFRSKPNYIKIAKHLTARGIPWKGSVDWQTIENWMEQGFCSDNDTAIELWEKAKGAYELKYLIRSKKYTARKDEA